MTAQPAPGMPHTPTEGTAPWIPSMYGDDCPHRPEWTCPEHDECRACECNCNTYVADLEEPDLTLIPADLVVRNPEVCSGRPTMRGTRILASRIAGELAAGTSWEVLHEWYPSMPVPAAQPLASAPGAVQGSTDRGTGELKPHDSLQTIDGRHLTGPQVISRVLVLAFGTRHNREHIGEIADHLDAALRILHYREVVASLRKIADADEKADPPIGGEVDYLRGWRHAANRIESVAKDLEDGNQ